MAEYVAFMFSGFWIFIGCWIIIGSVISCINYIVNRFLRHFTILKHGYPPPHCDADGEFKEDKEEDNK